MSCLLNDGADPEADDGVGVDHEEGCHVNNYDG
jgi:hypothetical protein